MCETEFPFPSSEIVDLSGSKYSVSESLVEMECLRSRLGEINIGGGCKLQVMASDVRVVCEVLVAARLFFGTCEEPEEMEKLLNDHLLLEEPDVETEDTEDVLNGKWPIAALALSQGLDGRLGGRELLFCTLGGSISQDRLLVRNVRARASTSLLGLTLFLELIVLLFLRPDEGGVSGDWGTSLSRSPSDSIAR